MNLSKLSTEEEDTLREILNISFGCGANILHKLIDKDIIFEIPKIGSSKKLKTIIDEEFLSDQVFISILQVTKPYDMASYLIISKKDGERLIKYQSQSQSQEMSVEDYHEAINECSNMILNSIFGSLANQSKIELEFMAPLNEVYGLQSIKQAIPALELEEKFIYSSNLMKTTDNELIINFYITLPYMIRDFLIKVY